MASTGAVKPDSESDALYPPTIKPPRVPLGFLKVRGRFHP